MSSHSHQQGKHDSAHDSSGAKPTPAEVYAQLRKTVLALKPQDLGLADGMPLAALMETGCEKAIVTLVAVADGSTSLYFSTGGGVLGAGAHAPVHQASAAFLASLAENQQHLQPTTDLPLPGLGRVRFYLIGGKGIKTAEAAEEDLGYYRHALSPVFQLAHNVIKAIRENTPAQR